AGERAFEIVDDRRQFADEGLLFRGGAALSALGGSFAKVVEVGGQADSQVNGAGREMFQMCFEVMDFLAELFAKQRVTVKDIGHEIPRVGSWLGGRHNRIKDSGGLFLKLMVRSPSPF